jgi:hypothetical protein
MFSTGVCFLFPKRGEVGIFSDGDVLEETLKIDSPNPKMWKNRLPA